MAPLQDTATNGLLLLAWPCDIVSCPQAVISALPQAALPRVPLDDEAKPKKKRKKAAQAAAGEVAPVTVPDPGDEGVELAGPSPLQPGCAPAACKGRHLGLSHTCGDYRGCSDSVQRISIRVQSSRIVTADAHSKWSSSLLCCIEQGRSNALHCPLTSCYCCSGRHCQRLAIWIPYPSVGWWCRCGRKAPKEEKEAVGWRSG